MLWKLGWLLNSLKFRVEKDTRDTLFKNDVFLRNRWSLPERLVVWCSKHVLIANGVLFSIASACFFLIAEYYTLIQTFLPQTLSGFGPLVEFQSTIFSAQVTLLGFIFPPVIAISILLQGKSSHESMWMIYLHNSGVMLVVCSALTLFSSLVLLKICESWLTHQFLVAASISTTVWFLTNLVLSVWCLWKTLAFLSLNYRMTMVAKYAINEALPSEIKNRLLVHRGSSAIKPAHRQLTFEKVTGVLLDQIEDSLKDNNSRLFQSATEDLAQLHREVESSMSFINSDAEPGNLLLLPIGEWSDLSLLGGFVRAYSAIAKNVTRRIQDDSNYFESWCYFYPRLFMLQEKNSPAKVAETYIDEHYLIWEGLMSWMGGFDKNNNVSAQKRDRAIKDFVGSWEYWEGLLYDDLKSVKSKGFLVASRHLYDSCCMIVCACKYNNNDAAIWATDVLSHWFELFSSRNIGYHYHRWNHELITTKALGLDFEHSLLKSLTCNNDFSKNDFSKVEAANIGLRNYWTDLRCLTAACLLATSHKKKNDYKNLTDALISGNRLAPSGNHVNYSPLASAKGILGVYLRQYGSWETQSDYRELMEQSIDGLASIEKPALVPGRSYSSSDPRGTYLLDFFQVMGIGLTTKEFKINRKWLEFLKSNAISLADLESTISSLKGLINIEDSIINSVSDYFEVDLEESKKSSQFFVSSIEKIIAELESTISKKIINAPIDQNRLLQFGAAASGSTFTLSDGPMPAMFFDDIDYKDDFNSDLFVINIPDYRKSDVSQGLEVNRTTNENEWLNNIVSRQMQDICFRQLLEHRTWKKLEFDDAKSLTEGCRG